jgi:DNA-binding NarL/FixJ family response regulator
MNLQYAKSRRLMALQRLNSDRVLVAPAKHKSELRLPEKGTVAAYLIDALGDGLTVDQIAAETEWSKSTTMVNLYKVAKRTGVGIRRGNERLHLVLPDGTHYAFPRSKTISEH